jgi:hypothetical protein
LFALHDIARAIANVLPTDFFRPTTLKKLTPAAYPAREIHRLKTTKTFVFNRFMTRGSRRLV